MRETNTLGTTPPQNLGTETTRFGRATEGPATEAPSTEASPIEAPPTSIAFWRSFTLVAALVVAIGTGVTRALIPGSAGDTFRDPTSREAPPATRRPEHARNAAPVTFASPDGSIRFSVPRPGDSVYDDYLEMLQHPRYQSAFSNAPGYALPYDPEWRSVVRGRREVDPVEHEFEGGERSMEELAAAFVAALEDGSEQALFDLRVNRHEFEAILWPEFPQSRPYLKITTNDAWMLHHSASLSGIRMIAASYRGHELELVDVAFEDAFEYTNFTMFRNVVIRVRDRATQTEHDIQAIPAIVSRNGRYKAYMYSG